MADDGTGSNWNTALPANSDDARDVGMEIRDAKAAVGTRIAYEHSAFDVANAGGVHVAGSGQFWCQTAAPTTTPGGTVLSTVHKGRGWIDITGATGGFHGVMKFWDGSAWQLPSIVSGAQLQPGVVSNAAMGTNSVVGTNIVAGAITQAHISNASVGTAQLIDSNVTSGKIAAGAILTAHIGAAQVLTVNIADTNVTTGKLADAAVTTAKIADTNVSTGKIADSAVTLAKIAASSKVFQGSYTGNGSATGPTLTCGFQPAYVVIFDSQGNGQIWSTVNGLTTLFRADGGASIASAITFSSTGFQIVSANAGINTNARSYIVVCFG